MTDELTEESWVELVRAARDLGLTPKETREWLAEVMEGDEDNED